MANDKKPRQNDSSAQNPLYDHEQRLAAGAACLKAALAYRKLGLAPVILCDPHHTGIAKQFKSHHERCKPRSFGKAPIVRWQLYQEVLPDVSEIEGWWYRYPIGNIGIVLGPVSALVRIDVDGKTGRERLQECSDGDLPTTWMFTSPGSDDPQYLYAWPATLSCKSTTKTGEGEHEELRLQAHGEQTVMPPSRHQKGGYYSWVPGYSPEDISPAMAPQWLIDRLTVKTMLREIKAPAVHPGQSLALEDLSIPDDIKTLIQNGVPKGQRSEALRKVQRALIKAKYSPDEIQEVLMNPDHGISEKPLERGAAWTFADIARAREGAAETPSNGVRTKRAAMMVESQNTSDDVPLRVIRVTTRPTEIIDQAEAAILEMKPPIVYQRSRTLSIITKQGPQPKWLRRASDAPTIIELSPEFLWELCSKSAAWEKFDKRSDHWTPTLPPKWVSQTLIKRDGWKFPVLTGIVTSPTLRPDGSVIEQSGYDPGTGLYLDLNGSKFPRIPNNPTFDDAKAAQTQLQTPFEEFDYEDTSQLASVLADILTILGRNLIDGPTPMWVFSGTKAGSGKTLLAQCASRIGTGRNPSIYSQTSDDEEERKRLFTIAMHGDAVALIDNITQPLGSAALNMVLTTEEITDRVLGANKQVTASWNAVLMGTGNNITFRGDMFRRVMPVKLDPKVANPESRTGFKIPNLEAYVKANRPELAVAGLIILKAYMEAGKPQQPGLDEIGGFEEWNHLIRHCLVWLGCEDPAATRYTGDDSDPIRFALSRMLKTWHECYGDAPQTLRVVLGDIGQKAHQQGPGNEWNDLQEALAEFDSSYDNSKALNPKKIGNTLRKHHGHMVDNLRFQRADQDTHSKTQQWQVKKM